MTQTYIQPIYRVREYTPPPPPGWGVWSKEYLYTEANTYTTMSTNKSTLVLHHTLDWDSSFLAEHKHVALF